jgi:hypothetical protein
MLRQPNMTLKELESRHAKSSDRELTFGQFVSKYFPKHLHLLGGAKQKEAPKSKPLVAAILPESVSEVSADNSPVKKSLSGGTCAGSRKACRKTTATHTGSETQADQPAQTPQQKWRNKNKKKLAAYQKKWRAKNK